MYRLSMFCLLCVFPCLVHAQLGSPSRDVSAFAGLTWGQDSGAVTYGSTRQQMSGVSDGIIYEQRGTFLATDGTLSFGFCSGKFCYGEFVPGGGMISPLDATRILIAIGDKYGAPMEYQVDGKKGVYKGAAEVVKAGAEVTQSGVYSHTMQKILWQSQTGNIEIEIGGIGRVDNQGFVELVVRYQSSMFLRARASSPNSEY